MTPEMARKLGVEGAMNLPWDYPCMTFLPGRYYLGSAHLRIGHGPLFPHGGDWTCSVWRFLSEPTTWRIVGRVRIYAGPNSDAWTGGDEKRWAARVIEGREEDMKNLVDEFILELVRALERVLGVPPAAEKPEWLEFRGDAHRAMDIITNVPCSWMHHRMERTK